MFTCFIDHCSYNIYECTVWIGGSDKNTESQFIWSKSGNLITFLNWSIRSPNNLKGNQDCIEMFASNGRWNDRECDHNTPFICEKSLNWYRNIVNVVLSLSIHHFIEELLATKLIELWVIHLLSCKNNNHPDIQYAIDFDRN